MTARTVSADDLATLARAAHADRRIQRLLIVATILNSIGVLAALVLAVTR